MGKNNDEKQRDYFIEFIVGAIAVFLLIAAAFAGIIAIYPSLLEIP
jgi:hypothetical protein